MSSEEKYEKENKKKERKKDKFSHNWRPLTPIWNPPAAKEVGVCLEILYPFPEKLPLNYIFCSESVPEQDT